MVHSLMLAFALFTDDPSTCVLTQAYLFGADDLTIPGRVGLVKDMIVCDKPLRGNAGLGLQVRIEAPGVGGAENGTAPSDPLGLLSVATCLLPERDAPYLLSLELARRRIMMLLNKLEDWGLTDLPAASPVMQQFEAARRAFTEALVHQRTGKDLGSGGFSRVAERLARQALSIGVDCGENLALHSARATFAERVTGALHRRGIDAAEAAGEQVSTAAPVRNPEGVGLVLPTEPTVGCAVNPANFNDAMTQAIASSCDFVAVPMRWIDMEPNEGTYSFAKTDRWIEWAVRTAKMPVVAGPIVDFGRSCVPKWLSIWENDYETLRELVYEHVRQIVTRYRRAVSRWTIASGLHVNDGFSLLAERMLDLTRVCVLVVKKLHPQARVQVEIAQPWGEYFAVNKNALFPMHYAEMLGQAGLAIDAISLKVRMGHSVPGSSTRDMMELSDMLDRYAKLEKPIAVSLGAPSASPTDARVDPGDWRGPWSPERQAAWLDTATTVCLGKSFVSSVCWQELADGPEMLEMPSGGLLAPDGTPKPAMAKLTEVRDRIRAAKAGRKS